MKDDISLRHFVPYLCGQIAGASRHMSIGEQ
jgi:hypothetical protein